MHRVQVILPFLKWSFESNNGGGGGGEAATMLDILSRLVQEQPTAMALIRHQIITTTVLYRTPMHGFLAMGTIQRLQYPGFLWFPCAKVKWMRAKPRMVFYHKDLRLSVVYALYAGTVFKENYSYLFLPPLKSLSFKVCLFLRL